MIELQEAKDKIKQAVRDIEYFSGTATADPTGILLLRALDCIDAAEKKLRALRDEARELLVAMPEER